MNKIKITTTGSFPPIDYEKHDEQEIEDSIKNAIEKQLEAGVDILTDGQVRSDIVGIFARSIGLEGDGHPYFVRKLIGKPESSIILKDLRTAHKYSGGAPLKAHITGPTVIAESCRDDELTPARYRDKDGFECLTLDLADALAEDARLIAKEAKELNIQYLQIDEPSLAYGADMGLAKKALERIVNAWHDAGGGETILHACGGVEVIILDLLQFPIDILNLENSHLLDLDDKTIEEIKKSGKKIALGIIRVNTDYVPSPQRVAKEIYYRAKRLSPDLVWGVTPACGLRLSPPDLALKRMNCLVEARKKLAQ